MKKRYRILSLALLSACLIGCSGGKSPEGTGSDYRFDPSIDVELNYLTAREFHPNRTAGKVSDRFRAAYADLALKLLTSCRADQGSDTMISPLSIMTALAMTANGADGDTLAQMEALLGGNLDIEALNQQIFNFYASLSNTESASFKAANSIWVTSLPVFTVNPDFIKTMENTYNADVLSIDFSKSKDAADAINSWCNEKTDGMIPEVATPEQFNAATVMALLNALSFDAKWAQQYPKWQCHPGVFHGTKGDTDVTMLCDTLESGYLKGERETGFIREYEGGKYAFVALLPNAEGDISDYLDALDGSYLLDLIKNPDQGSYYLSTRLPAFKQETSLELQEILENLGMTDAFKAGKADFSRLGNAGGGFCIGQVIHKTFIEVNNAGTRAAAVTMVDMTMGGMGGPERQETVILDRPFVYAIIDTATSLPIFIGSCENVG